MLEPKESLRIATHSLRAKLPQVRSTDLTAASFSPVKWEGVFKAPAGGENRMTGVGSDCPKSQLSLRAYKGTREKICKCTKVCNLERVWGKTRRCQLVSINPNSLHPEKSPITTAHTDLYLKRHAWGTRSFYCRTMKTQNCRIYRISFRPSVQAKRRPEETNAEG